MSTSFMNGIADTVLAVLMIASFALTGGGVYLIVRRNERRQGILMLIAAAIIFLNVLIWVVPLPHA